MHGVVDPKHMCPVPCALCLYKLMSLILVCTERKRVHNDFLLLSSSISFLRQQKGEDY